MKQQFGMNQRMQQRMIMTPMLQQAMKILQLSTLELKEFVEKEMLENPVLEEDNEDSTVPTDKNTLSDESNSPSTDQEGIPEDPLFEKTRQRHETDLVEHIKEAEQLKGETWHVYHES